MFNVWAMLLTLTGLWAVLKDYNPHWFQRGNWKKFQVAFRELTLGRAQEAIEKENAKIEAVYQERLAELDRKIREVTDAARSVNQEELIQAKRREIDELTRLEYEKNQALSFAKSLMGSARSKYEFLKNDPYSKSVETERARQEYERYFEDVQRLTPAAEAAYADLNRAKEELSLLQAGPAPLIREKSAIFAERDRWRNEVEAIRPSDAVSFLASVARDVPLADWIDPKYNLRQTVLDGLPDLTGAPKVDRCTTCHVGIDDPGYDDPSLPMVFRAHPKLELYVGPKSPHPLEQLGCTSCHLGRGYGTTFKLAAHTPDTEEQATEWRRRYGWKDLHYWDYPMLPKRNMEAMCFTCHKTNLGYELSMARSVFEGRRIYEYRGCHGCHKIDGVSDDMAKIGPTLEHVAVKLNPDWTPRWISGPRKFYPTARMPHAFGHRIPIRDTFPEFFETMEHETEPALWQEIERQLEEDHAHMVREEAAMIEGITALLYARSRDLPLEEPPAEAGDPALGRQIVKVHNCLGCHELHDGEIQSPGQGYAPDLSKVGSKTNRPWLFNWLREPKRYWPEARMPDPRLTPEETNHVVAYLLTLRDDAYIEAPRDQSSDDEMLELAVRYLRSRLSEAEARQTATAMSPEERRLLVGEETIYRNGCFGCHDIPGFEDRGRIGTELTGEGFKEIERFDFGMHRFVHIPHFRHEWVRLKVKQPQIYFLGKVISPYEQTLSMPWFGFSDEDADKITTFVLGQTGKQPPEKYVYTPGGDQQAILEGRKLIERRNCIGCHKIGMGWQWVDTDEHGFDEDLVWVTEPLVALGDANLPEGRYSRIAQVGEAKAQDKVLIPAEGFVDTRQLARFGEDYLSIGELLGEAPIEVNVGSREEIRVAMERPATLKVEGVQEGYIKRFYEDSALAPPILRREGAKVRPQWFFNFLKHVTDIRNHIQVRMPQWEWNDAEANAVVRFFAAAAGEPFPFESEPISPLSEEVHGTTARELFGLPGTPEYEQSLKCFSCHPAGELVPTNPRENWGPNLYLAQERLKFSFIRSWLRNPQAWSPGTRMPNIFYDYSDPDGVVELRPDGERQIVALAEMLHYLPNLEEVRLAAQAEAERRKTAVETGPGEVFEEDDGAEVFEEDEEPEVFEEDGGV